MKHVIIIATILLSGCGAIQDVAKSCSGDLKTLCRMVFGGSQDADQDAAIEDLQAAISTLEKQIKDDIALLQEAYGHIPGLQTQINNNISVLAQLQGYSYVSEIIDPCGDGIGFDEILIRLSTGELLAYFESGNKRFLTVLTPGSYKTTDLQSCKFKVLNDGSVVW